MSASPTPDLGQSYVLVRSIGRGGIGEVFEAVHSGRGRVAVKVLLASHEERGDIADRLRLEADILARLHHPNIVKIFESGVSQDGRPFFAMELLAGESLLTALERRGPFPAADAVTIACQALAGLGAAHEAGIIHRDVKPGNLHLVETRPAPPRVKLLDFGIAKLLMSGGSAGPTPLAVPTAKGALLGTPRYLSPEQITGRPLDARADLYAVGLVLYRMLAGRGPFDDVLDFADVMRAQVTTTPPSPSSFGVAIPRELDLVVMRALAKSPDARFGSAAEFRHQLERVLEETQTHGSSTIATYDGPTRNPADDAEATVILAPAAPAHAPPTSPRVTGRAAFAMLALVVVLLVGVAAFVGARH